MGGTPGPVSHSGTIVATLNYPVSRGSVPGFQADPRRGGFGYQPRYASDLQRAITFAALLSNLVAVDVTRRTTLSRAVKYVGQTVYLLARISSHRTRWTDLVAVPFASAPFERLTEVEDAFIVDGRDADGVVQHGPSEPSNRGCRAGRVCVTRRAAALLCRQGRSPRHRRTGAPGSGEDRPAPYAALPGSSTAHLRTKRSRPPLGSPRSVCSAKGHHRCAAFTTAILRTTSSAP